ncbi:MAG: hypothetical protein FWD16_00660, partial [Clostridia bacterium]|nr:hypothetical protein [Clostridia bacterium]
KEESRKITITRRQVKFFLLDLQSGDISDIKYRKLLINTLVDRLYLYDDGRLTIICYNGDTTVTIDVNLIDSIEEELSVTGKDKSYYLEEVPSPESESANPLTVKDLRIYYFLWKLCEFRSKVHFTAVVPQLYLKRAFPAKSKAGGRAIPPRLVPDGLSVLSGAPCAHAGTPQGPHPRIQM